MSTTSPRSYEPSRPSRPDEGILRQARRSMVGGALFFAVGVVVIAFGLFPAAPPRLIASLPVIGLLLFVGGLVQYRKTVVAHRMNVVIADTLRPQDAHRDGPPRDTRVDADAAMAERPVFAYRTWHKAGFFLGSLFLLALLAGSIGVFAFFEHVWEFLLIGPLVLLGGVAGSAYGLAQGVGLLKHVNAAVVLTDEGFEVVRRNRRTAYAWSDGLTFVGGMENTYSLLDKDGATVFTFDGDIAAFAALRTIITAKLEHAQDPYWDAARWLARPIARRGAWRWSRPR